MKNRQLGEKIRDRFPIFKSVPGHLAFLDSAASSQKPAVVIDRITHYLSVEHANIHRGAYRLSAYATEAYENARKKVASFLGAADERSIVFGKNATEAINLVAFSWGEKLNPGDRILLTTLEHHSNIVPWQLLAARKGLKIDFAAINPDATLNIEDFREKLIAGKPKIVSVIAQSNSFGALTPIEEIIAMAHGVGAKILVDATQYVVHAPVNVKDLDVDFLVFTGHKLYGPTGVGVLYGKPELFEQMGPFLGGGDMIEQVTVNGSTWAEIPRRFEAGTPAIAEVIGLKTAIDFVEEIGISNIAAHEQKVYEYGIEQLQRESGVELYGPYKTPGAQRSIIPFNVKGVHPHDLGTVLDSVNVQIRAGHHCAMPALKALGLQSTARASLAVYSDTQDIDALCHGIREARKIFSK
jgi:cysteine desulfurase/selenocysteine lyase